MWQFGTVRGTLFISSKLLWVFDLNFWRRPVSQYHVERLLVPGKSAFQPVQIWSVADIGLVNFDKEVMIFKIAEPIDPPDFDLLTEFAIVWHFEWEMLDFFIFFQILYYSLY